MTKTIRILFAFITACVSGLIIYSVNTQNMVTDYMDHIHSVIQMSEGNRQMPGNFFFFVILQSFSLFSVVPQTLMLVLTLILCIAIAAKFNLSMKTGLQYILEDENQNDSRPIFLLGMALLFFSLIFVQPIPSWSSIADGDELIAHLRFYDGKFSISNWHNSTGILVIPFAILLFTMTLEYLQKPSTSSLVQILLMCILVIYSKPNFFFVVVVIFPLFVFLRFGFTQTFKRALVMVIVAGTCLCLQYYAVYLAADPNVEKSGVVIAPFHVWNYFSSNIPLDVLLSCLFPLSVSLFYYQTFGKEMRTRYAWSLFLFGILIYILFSETGRWEYHGNFSWQNNVTTYLIFFVGLTGWIKQMQVNKAYLWKDFIISCIFVLHLASGIAYLYKAFTYKIFWSI